MRTNERPSRKPRNPRYARCTACGLQLRHHFDARNVKLACSEARAEHPYAGERLVGLHEALLASLEATR